ncbi:NADPH-dependent FMN reductase [Sphingomonas sp. BIUV-7]|uniref:NADPH-dependent FMN reductase n=1 Tax=Sphingomonas natans TaxID=3063330 RepID=A0ABT8YAC6_9SPHN|nr:NADPH-dependent FMN reductase [Sphingomonas sp. BIUV-7]MDO6415292.1 NADPH-dependent FMN reductase [Sphingomonas sp. BIUV-7]
MIEQPTLRLVTMVGSLRQGSYSAAIARTLAALAPDDVVIEPLASIGDLPHYNADTQADGFPAAVLAMAEAIQGADGVIIVTPEYNYSFPGVLKNALDWLSRVSPSPFARKPVALQSSSPGLLGGSRAQYQLRQVFIFLDAMMLNKPEVMIGQVATKVAGDPAMLTDAPTRDFVAGQIATFAEFIRRHG